MNAKLLGDTIAAHFAGRVNYLLGDYVSIESCDYDALTDICTILTSSAMDNISASMQALELRIKARAQVQSASIYACKKGGFRVELRGCMDEYKRWTREHLRIRYTDRFLYIIIGIVVAVAFYFFSR